MLTTKQISTKIGGIKRSSKSLRDNVQIVLAHTCGHVLEHGNVTLFNNLLAASVGVNKGKLIGYAKQYGLVTFDHKSNNFNLNKKARTAAVEKYKSGDDLISFLGEQPKWYEEVEVTLEIVDPKTGETKTETVVNGGAKKEVTVDVSKRIDNLTKAIRGASEVDTAGIARALNELNDAIKEVKSTKAVAKAA